MSDPFNKLPRWAQANLVVPPGQKGWEKCKFCDIYKSAAALKACSACSGLRIHPIYYCNDECQRADLAEHKAGCDALKKQKSIPKKGRDVTKEMPDLIKRFKWLQEWELINAQTVFWCMHCVYACSFIDISKVIFDVFVDFDTAQIVGFDIPIKATIGKPWEDQLYRQDLKQYHGSSNLWYRIVGAFKGGELDPTSASLYRRDLPKGTTTREKDFSTIHLAWPWVGAQLTKGNETSSWVAKKKLDLLVTALENHRKNNNKDFLESFMAPSMSEETSFTMVDMDWWAESWQRLIYGGHWKRTDT